MKQKISFKAGKNFIPESTHLCKVICAGNTMDVTIVKKSTKTLQNYKRISSNQGINLATGKTFEYTPSPPRWENEKGIYHSLENFERIVNHNFRGDETERQIILCCDENISGADGYKIANEEAKRFWRDFRKDYPMCESVRLLLPTATGRWTIRMLIKDISGATLSISCEQLRAYWKQGLITISPIPKNGNVGEYFADRVADILFSETYWRSESRDDCRFGLLGYRSRIYCYPETFRLYLATNKIVTPKAKRLPYGEVMELARGAQLCDQGTLEIVSNTDKRSINSIMYLKYKLPLS